MFESGVVGNQVEEKMFNCLQSDFGYSLTEDSTGSRAVSRAKREGDDAATAKHVSHRLEIVKTFEFAHSRMTMSVVVRNANTAESVVFVKVRRA